MAPILGETTDGNSQCAYMVLSRFCLGNMAKQLYTSRFYKVSDRRLTYSGADFLIDDMCCEWDVQDISQASLWSKASFGRYSHTPCVGSVKKYWQYIYTLYKRSLVDNEIDVRQIPRFSAFMHVRTSSIRLRISISLSPPFCKRRPIKVAV